MRQSDDRTQGPRSTTTAAMARTIEGGLAYVADIARRWAPYLRPLGVPPTGLGLAAGFAQFGRAQEQLAGGRRLWRAHPIRLPVLAEQDRLGRRRRPRCAVHLRHPTLGGPSRRAGSRRNRLCETRAPRGRSGPSVHRYGWQGGELPHRRVVGVCQSAGPALPGPGAVLAREVDPGPGALPAGRDPGGPRLRDQASAGPSAAGACPRVRRPRQLGDRGLRVGP